MNKLGKRRESRLIKFDPGAPGFTAEEISASVDHAIPGELEPRRPLC
jgi:hypothetical protein